MTFIFYDTETTGTDVHFSQILQFAAILTDDDLNPIDQFDIRSRIQPHIVPSIGAMRVTGVTAEQLVDPKIPTHFEMVREIHAVMSGWSPATVVGYNTIRFDEELLRQAFYQSLLPIYLTNTGGNSRLDILKAAQAVYAFAPDALIWPINEKGKPVFKLDQLAPANGFAHENAHDALADVEATIFIAKLIKQRAPEIWQALLRFRGKADASRHALASPYLPVTKPGFGSAKSSLIAALQANPTTLAS